MFHFDSAGPSSLGVPGVPGHTQILADHLTLFQPGGKDFAHLITNGTPGFSDLKTALLKQTSPPIIWIFTESEGDGIEYLKILFYCNQ